MLLLSLIALFLSIILILLSIWQVEDPDIRSIIIMVCLSLDRDMLLVFFALVRLELSFVSFERVLNILWFLITILYIWFIFLNIISLKIYMWYSVIIVNHNNESIGKIFPTKDIMILISIILTPVRNFRQKVSLRYHKKTKVTHQCR